MKLTINAKKVFLAMLILNTLLVVVIAGVFVAASNTAKKKSQQISEQNADLESNDQLINDYKALKASLEGNKDLEDLTSKALPSDKDQSEAVKQLDKFSKDAKMPIQQITFNAGTNKGTGNALTSPSGVKSVSVISVSLHIVSTRYDNLLKFMKKVENSPRLMQVTSLTINPDSVNPKSIANVDLTVGIYLKSGK